MIVHKIKHAPSKFALYEFKVKLRFKPQANF
jgi:hypothetical protein